MDVIHYLSVSTIPPPDSESASAAANRRWRWLPYLLLPSILLSLIVWDVNRPERYEGGVMVRMLLPAGQDIEHLPDHEKKALIARLRSAKSIGTGIAKARLAKAEYGHETVSVSWEPFDVSLARLDSFAQLVGSDGTFIDACSRSLATDLNDEFTVTPLKTLSGDPVLINCYPSPPSQHESSWILRNVNVSRSWQNIRREFTDLVFRITHPRRVP